MAIAYIALGSNLGERRKNLDQALQLLGQVSGISITKVSSFRETEPVGGPPGQDKYLNAAAELETKLEAGDLLLTLLHIETRLGRVRQERFGPRTIDLDLLLYGQEKIVMDDPNLIVPHPRLHERFFVLEPLAEIAPLAVHPGLQSTVQDLLRRLQGNKDRDLTGLRALVTGSTSGIGRAIALELARGGAAVLIHGRRSQDRAQVVASQVETLAGRSGVVMGDLRDEKVCQQVFDAAWKMWEGLDIWVNNAGADTLTGEAAHWSYQRKLEELWAIDVRATMLLSRAAGQHMQGRGQGVIVNMGWDQAETGMEGDSPQLFATVKGAVMCFSKSLARSLAPQVRVHCLAPGWIRTAWGEKASQVWQERVLRETPLARWGTPEDVANATRWLVSPEASFLTGQIMRVNGGAVM
jgi:3-oxoacyl-[acyl-carrier protein] reductase